MDIFWNCTLHVIFNLLVFWMAAWMDDTIHVKVQVVKFIVIGVW